MSTTLAHQFRDRIAKLGPNNELLYHQFDPKAIELDTGNDDIWTIQFADGSRFSCDASGRCNVD